MRIDCPCLDCGLPIAIEIRDGTILNADPAGITAYVAVPLAHWYDNLPYA